MRQCCMHSALHYHGRLNFHPSPHVSRSNRNSAPRWPSIYTASQFKDDVRAPPMVFVALPSPTLLCVVFGLPPFQTHTLEPIVWCTCAAMALLIGSTIAVVLLAITLQAQLTTVVPCCTLPVGNISLSTRQTWCNVQLNTCVDLCGGQGQTAGNSCDSVRELQHKPLLY